MPFGIVYLWTNTINNKRYVGITTRALELRIDEHMSKSRGKESTAPIHHAIRKYGRDAFIVELICECSSLEELYTQEKHFADTLNTWAPKGYNLSAGVGPTSHIITEEAREKMSLAKRGERSMWFGTTGPMKGRKQSQHFFDVMTKTYIFLSPNGEETTLTNIREFCRERGLSHTHMIKVFRGERGQHKGWRKAV